MAKQGALRVVQTNNANPGEYMVFDSGGNMIPFERMSVEVSPLAGPVLVIATKNFKFEVARASADTDR